MGNGGFAAREGMRCLSIVGREGGMGLVFAARVRGFWGFGWGRGGDKEMRGEER